MAVNADPGVQMILQNVETVVASEGGSIEFIEIRDGRLVIKYTPGVNEECPECVPDHALVEQMMKTSVSVYAPHISSIEVL